MKKNRNNSKAYIYIDFERNFLINEKNLLPFTLLTNKWLNIDLLDVKNIHFYLTL